MLDRVSVRINRKPWGNKFLTINTANLINSFKSLGKEAYILYLFLASNENGYYKTLVCDWLKKDLGFSDEELETATNELIEKRYLVENGSTYEFYEVPLAKAENEEKERKLTLLGF